VSLLQLGDTGAIPLAQQGATNSTVKLPTTDDTDRGQVGIGTLIIFIALVLVAAVAAGVLVNTSGELQSRASDTGDDAQAQVSNQIDVVSATGNTGGDSDVDTITLVVKKSPGSDPIDLSEATIEYTSEGSSATLTEGSGFTASAVSDTSSGSQNADKILEGTNERVEITIDLANTGGLSALSEGQDAQLEIVDQSGASTVYGVNVPDVLTGTYVEV
jgi:flagellin FlaB